MTSVVVAVPGGARSDVDVFQPPTPGGRRPAGTSLVGAGTRRPICPCLPGSGSRTRWARADRPRPTPRRTPRQEAVADADPGAGCVAPCRPTKRASNQPLTATHRTPGGSRTPDAFRTVGSHVRCHWPTRRSTTCRASISCPGAQLPVVVLHCVGVRVDPRLLLAPPDRGYLRHEALRPRGPVAPWPRRQPPGRPPRRRPAAVPGPAAARVPVRPVREHRVDQGEQPLRFPGVGRAHRKDVFSVASSSRRMTWSAWGAREFCGVPDLPRTPVVAAAGLHVQPAAPGCPDPRSPSGTACWWSERRSAAAAPGRRRPPRPRCGGGRRCTRCPLGP